MPTPLTANVDLEDIKRKLSPRTKAIVVVHWAGNPVDLNALRDIQDYCQCKFGHRPTVIEDCAHAFGAQYDGKPIGAESERGNICVFSTQAIKHLTTGDGGIITLPNQELYDRCKLLRWYGIDRTKRSGGDFRLEPDIEEWGYKFHMNDISATIGIHNLPHIKSLQEKTFSNFKTLEEKTKRSKYIFFISETENSRSAHWLCSILILDGRKEEFMLRAKEAGITVSQVHNRNDGHSCVEKFREPLPQLDQLEKELVCIPVGWWLTPKEVDHIARFINNFGAGEQKRQQCSCVVS